MMILFIMISALQKIVVSCRVILTSLDNSPINGRWCLGNPKKCEFLRIFNKTNITPNTYYINNHLIKELTHAKYLRVIIDQDISWNEHIKQISSKATKLKCISPPQFISLSS